MVFITGKREIYEKTLELNICAEILTIIRSQPRFEKAVWQGLTQAQERSLGLDELLRNIGPGKHLMLQFKAPWPSSTVDRLYKFSINTRQHQTLETKLACTYPSGVFYVLPLFVQWTKVNSYAPRLAKDTWLLPVKDVNSKALGLWQERHRLEVDKAAKPPRASVFSPQVDTKLLNAEEAFHAAGDMFPLQGLVPSESLVEWVGTISQYKSIAPHVPNRFRGLHSIFIPG